MFHPLGHSRVRNKDVSTVIVGGIKRGRGCTSTYHALASLDGGYLLIDIFQKLRAVGGGLPPMGCLFFAVLRQLIFVWAVSCSLEI